MFSFLYASLYGVVYIAFNNTIHFLSADPQPGIFGKLKFEGEPDYYGDSNGSFIPLLGLNKPRDIAERRKLISDKPDISGMGFYYASPPLSPYLENIVFGLCV